MERLDEKAAVYLWREGKWVQAMAEEAGAIREDMNTFLDQQPMECTCVPGHCGLVMECGTCENKQ